MRARIFLIGRRKSVTAHAPRIAVVHVPNVSSKCPLSHSTFSTSTRASRTALGLEPERTGSIAYTGPVTAADTEVLRQSSPEQRLTVFKIKQAAKERDWSTASSVFNEIERPSPLTYAVMLHAADRCGRSKEAFTLYENMCRENIPRSAAMFTPLINLAAKQGRLEQALSVLSDMQDSKIDINAHTCAAVVKAYGNARDAAGALHFYEEMLRNNVQPDEILLASVMSTCAATGDVTRTEALMENAANVHRNVVHYNCLLKACRKAADPNAAFRVLADMTRNAVMPDVISYTCIVGSLIRSDDRLAQLDRMLAEMATSGIRANEFFVEEHISCIRGSDRLTGDNIGEVSEDVRASMMTVIKEARAADIRLTRLTLSCEKELLDADSSAVLTEWVQVIPKQEGDAQTAPYYWDKLSGRTQWEAPLQPIVETVVVN